MAYPVSFDDLLGELPPSGDHNLFEYDHYEHHKKEDAAIEALEAKVGLDNSTDPNSIDYLLKNPASLNPGHKHNYLFSPSGNPQQSVYADQWGWIGFGTTSPRGKYHFFMNNQTFENYSMGIRLGAGQPGMYMALGIVDNPSSGNSRGYIKVTHDWGTYYDLILQPGGGNVGIGYPSTEAPLYIARPGNAELLTLSLVAKNSSDNSNIGPKIDFRVGTSETTMAEIVSRIRTSGSLQDSELIIRTRAANYVGERIRIGANGWVAIGGTSPEAMLHLNYGHLLLTNTYAVKAKDTGGTQRLLIRLNSSNKIEIGESGIAGINIALGSGNLDVSNVFYTATGKIIIRPESTSNEGGQIDLLGATGYNSWSLDNFQGHFRFHHDGTEYLRFTSGGYLGLGVSSPAYRIELPNTASAAGQGRANAWVTYSDRRYKKNIRQIKNALEKVEKLRGVYFSWKKSNKQAIGLIAQEVEKVIPEVVSTDEKGIKALDYERLIALLIEAIKELKNEIKKK